MNTTNLLKEFRKKGFDLIALGDRLRVKPKHLITPHFRGLLNEHRSDVLRALALETLSLRALPSQLFDDAKHCFEVIVPWLPASLWFVPEIQHANVLISDGVCRGRIWTAHEIRQLWALPDLTPDRVQTIARIKYGFDIGIASIGSEPQPDESSGKRKGPAQCYSCHGARYWRSTGGLLNCSTCHPPASDDLVAEWIQTDPAGGVR